MRVQLTVSLFLAAIGAASASPTTYNLSFTGSTRPISGSFTYDPATGFSNFLVTWDFATYDLTASANAPTLVGNNPCSGRSSTPAYGFFIMQQLTTGCNPGTSWVWSANNTGTSSIFEFVELQPGGGTGDNIFQTQNFGDGFGVGNGGSYSITAVTPEGAPEPETWGLLGSGIAGLLIASRRRLRR